jgi:trehalose-6-phosphate synthase
MPLPERRERHAALLESITRESASQWRQHFLEELSATPASGERVLRAAGSAAENATAGATDSAAENTAGNPLSASA